ncbi:MAG: glycine--tRNA ligase [Thermoprotei archaeon]|nr:MAG: glycine--tRNA ligase [Thermoprotei archaeon]RLE98811.1 MAG: glycine--tRNA ligase [Thermoprotei archaeon]HDI74555.1 glycine--tRNA ligase [Thermoprotei archaeon]
MTKADKYEKLVELAKRRGFFWQSYEIYGGVSGFIDLGPLGTLLLQNIMNKWREYFVLKHQDFIVEITTPIISPEKVFIASGHVEHFTDYITQCKKCQRKFRADHLIEENLGINAEGLNESELDKIIRENNLRCPECGGELSSVAKFNLLFKTTIGPYSYDIGYARPEAAQGMFLTFKRIYEISGRKLPLGIAQIGRVMRNEISPRQGPIRLREFTIMEIELFFDPKYPQCHLLPEVLDREVRVIPFSEEKATPLEQRIITITVREALDKKYILNEWLAYFMAISVDFVKSLGIPFEKQIFIEKGPSERAHYAEQTFDQLVYLERWGWVEVSGHSYRTNYDLRRHMEYSKEDLRAYRKLETPRTVKKLQVVSKDIPPKIMHKLLLMPPEEVEKSLHERGFVEVDGYKISKDSIKIIVEKKYYERFIPHVSEPSFGAERLLYATLEYAYREEDGRIVLSLPRDIAPIKVAVLPLVKREKLPEIARQIYIMLMKEKFTVVYDEEGSIGRRYAKYDEIGVPFAITVDSQTLKDNTVTIRDRDTRKQIRVPINALPDVLRRIIQTNTFAYSNS